ncbi:MAG: TolC family protein [Paludibacteraceae bacterium]|nr:TolC family protein [Paludibacteraceae bacterium]
MNKKLGLKGLTIFAVLPLTSVAQQTLTIDDLFHISEEQSLQIRVGRTAVASATENVKYAKSLRLPDVGVGLNIGYLGDGQLGDRNFTDWHHVENPHFTNNFSVKAQQTIYAGGAIKSGIRLAEYEKAMAEFDLKNHRQEVRFMLVGHYLDLCRLQNEGKVIVENINLNDTLIGNTKSRVKAGTALQNDVTRYELQREQLLLQHQKVIDAMSILRHQLSTSLHQDLSQTTFVVDETALNGQNGDDEGWSQTALANSLMLQESATAIGISEQHLKMSRSRLLPKVGIVAEDHFDGPIITEVPVIDKNFNYWFVGVGVQYSLSSIWKGKKEVNRLCIDLQKVTEQHSLAQENISNAIQQAYTNYLTAQAELKTQQKSVQLAGEHYAVTNNRYNQGLCLLTDMLDAANMKLSAELALVNAQINILYNYYQLKYLSSNL